MNSSSGMELTAEWAATFDSAEHRANLIGGECGTPPFHDWQLQRHLIFNEENALEEIILEIKRLL